MEISRYVLKFLSREDVQSALARNDMQELYKLAADVRRQGDFLFSNIGELTSILMQAGIHPLEGMTEIPIGFLREQGGIKEFNIPEGITKINSSAFERTNLENITIPSSVKIIGIDAFYRCEDLKTVKLPTDVVLRERVFGFSGLESIELRDVKLQGHFIFDSCKQLKSVIIKGNTSEIPDRTFENCFNLAHVELPASLKEVGYYTFYHCDSLKEINFEGTVSQWKNIEIDENNEVLFSCKIICSDGTLKYDRDAKEWKQV